MPDPLDYDLGFREEIKRIVDADDDRSGLGPLDEAESSRIAHDEYMRMIRRLPAEDMKRYLKTVAQNAAEALSEENLDAVVKLWKKENDEDPLALFDPPGNSRDGGEFRTYKGFSRDTGLFVACLTGSFVCTTSDTMWRRLHQSDGVHRFEPDPRFFSVRDALSKLILEVPAEAFSEFEEPTNALAVRAKLRRALELLRNVEGPPLTDWSAVDVPNGEGNILFRVTASVPLGGFARVDVSRLLVTFGRTDDLVPVPLAILLVPSAPPSACRKRCDG